MELLVPHGPSQGWGRWNCWPHAAPFPLPWGTPGPPSLPKGALGWAAVGPPVSPGLGVLGRSHL